MAHLGNVNKQLIVNKQLTTSKILIVIPNISALSSFNVSNSPSGLFEINKQTAESKQTADLIKNSKFSFQTLLCDFCCHTVRGGLVVQKKKRESATYRPVCSAAGKNKPILRTNSTGNADKGGGGQKSQ